MVNTPESQSGTALAYPSNEKAARIANGQEQASAQQGQINGSVI